VLSDRLCIATNGTTNVVLSPQYLLSCDLLSLGCDGGTPPTAWSFLVDHGLPLSSCVPYTSSGGDRGSCPTQCTAGGNFTMYKAISSYDVSGLDRELRVERIQREVMERGPVQVAFMVWSDFMSYTSGVYERTRGSTMEGLHAVKLTGWGVEDGELYWEIYNSWSTNWGMNGKFRIKRGVDECGIESLAWAGQA
jgi:cathepsin B